MAFACDLARRLRRHRFPPPWSVEEQDARFVVKYESGQQFAYVYYARS
jgi:hypothetical protein